MTEWILVMCLGFSDTLGLCGHVRQTRYTTYADCARERDVLAKQPKVSYVYCRQAREPELVK